MALTLWFTGLSGAGKSTLAQAIARRLMQDGRSHQVVDGDELRRGLCADWSFSRADRQENIRRAAEVCRLLNRAGVIAIAALISPYRSDRAMARHVIGDDQFREVWLATPLEVCEQRDPKGLYRQARAGLIASFTGVSAPYEAPESADLYLNTDAMSLEACVTMTIALLQKEIS
jgi:adenylylsulfate kinase